MSWKIGLSVLFAVVLYMGTVGWGSYTSPQIGTELALSSVNGDAHAFYSSNIFQQHKTTVNSVCGIAFLLVMWGIWGSNLKALVKQTILLIMLGLIMTSTGCVRKYDVPEYVEVTPSQTAFVIPLENDTADQVKFNSESYFESKKVAAKRVQIPHRWNQTGRLPIDGSWIPTVKAIIVERSPVTREWESKGNDTKGKDSAIWIESADSVGFSMGWSCTAYIQETAASKFLYWYPSGSLANVMDNEVRARVQQTAAEVAARYKLDDLRSKKVEIADAVKQDCTNFFAARGITITTIGMFGGMTYENPKIQESIDQTFVSQQEKVNAAAMLAAQEDKNSRIKSEAQALADAAKTKAGGEAAGLELVNQALAKAANNPQLLQLRALEVESKRIEKWNGTYPNMVAGAGANTWVGLGDKVATPVVQNVEK